MTVLLLFECLHTVPIKEQKPSARLVHTQKGKKDSISGMRLEKCDSSLLFLAKLTLTFTSINTVSKDYAKKKLFSESTSGFFLHCHILISQNFPLFHYIVMLVITHALDLVVYPTSNFLLACQPHFSFAIALQSELRTIIFASIDYQDMP